jgi:hypothetical protein
VKGDARLLSARDVGWLENLKLTLAMLWIDQAMKRGRGRDFAFALVSQGGQGGRAAGPA